MTITYTEIGGESGQPRGSLLDKDYKRTYVRYFRAITDDPRIGSKAVREGVGIVLGNPYSSFGESDAGAYAENIAAVEDPQAGDGRQWIVTIDYGNYNAPFSGPDIVTLATPRLQFSTTRFQYPALLDIDGHLILNSAGDPFQNGVPIDASRPFMTIVRNQLSFSLSQSHIYKDSVNLNPWFGIPALWWKCLDISADETRDKDGNLYWAVTYQFELNPESWQIRIYNLGLRQLVGGRKVQILDDNEQPVDDPWPLNSDGTRKAAGIPADVINFHIYREEDFSALGFDSFYSDLISQGRLIP